MYTYVYIYIYEYVYIYNRHAYFIPIVGTVPFQPNSCSQTPTSPWILATPSHGHRRSKNLGQQLHHHPTGSLAPLATGLMRNEGWNSC